jgi:hypothetical protein
LSTAPTIPAERVRGTIGKLQPATKGTIEGTWTYSRNAYGPYVRNYIISWIDSQNGLRSPYGLLTTANAAWHAMTAEQKRKWNSSARAHNQTPYNRFIQVQFARKLQHQPISTTPP